MEDKKQEEVLITPQGEKLDLSVTGTMKIEVGKHSPVTNANRFKSLKYALAGLRYVLARVPSFRFASLITVLVTAVGIWLQVNPYLGALLILALGSIWITDCINIAIEASINLATSEPHPMAKVGKDVACAATLISTIVFVLVVLLILVPEILHHFRAAD